MDILEDLVVAGIILVALVVQEHQDRDILVVVDIMKQIFIPQVAVVGELRQLDLMPVTDRADAVAQECRRQLGLLAFFMPAVVAVVLKLPVLAGQVDVVVAVVEHQALEHLMEFLAPVEVAVVVAVVLAILVLEVQA